MAGVLRARESYADAASMLTEAADKLTELRRHYSAAVSLQNRARCYRSLGRNEMAEESFRDAEKLFRQEGAEEKLVEISAEIESLHAREKFSGWCGYLLASLRFWRWRS